MLLITVCPNAVDATDELLDETLDETELELELELDEPEQLLPFDTAFCTVRFQEYPRAGTDKQVPSENETFNAERPKL